MSFFLLTLGVTFYEWQSKSFVFARTFAFGVAQHSIQAFSLSIYRLNAKPARNFLMASPRPVLTLLGPFSWQSSKWNSNMTRGVRNGFPSPRWRKFIHERSLWSKVKMVVVTKHLCARELIYIFFLLVSPRTNLQSYITALSRFVLTTAVFV